MKSVCRILKHVVMALALSPTLCLAATEAPSPVVVMTSYPDSMVSRFEAAFEQAFPQYQIQVIWRQSADALDWLRQPGQGGVDVYWAPSPRNFVVLADENAWQPLGAAAQHIPSYVGQTQLHDAQNMYVAAELAGYGFVINHQVLQSEGLSPPTEWTDLADPGWADLLVIPDPRVGFAPVMIDIVLQAYGWEQGWDLWRRVSANARFADRGASFISDEILSGRAGAGVSIDFFAASAIAGGAGLDFVYPGRSGLNPAHIAITRDAENLEAARAFVSLVLSQAGQQLLAHPDIRKLPVLPAAYQGLAPGYHNPFAAAEQGNYRYDSAAGQPRLALVSALFEETIVANHDRLRDVLTRMHMLRSRDVDVSSTEQMLNGLLPLDETEAAALVWVFDRTAEPDAQREREQQQLRQRWRDHAATVLQRAEQGLLAQNGRDAFQLPRSGLTAAETERFAHGRQVFQRSWVVAPSRDPDFDGLGPLHSRLACISCHPGNGRGLAPADEQSRLLSSVVRMGLPQQNDHGSLPHPVYGRQLSEESVPGVLPEGRAGLVWHEHTVTFADGERITLRRPEVRFRSLNYGPAEDVTLSHLVGPPLVGLGLLADVPDAVLLSLASELNQDGIQGRVTGSGHSDALIGRFGYKASVPSIRVQNAKAMIDDLGITSSLFPEENCTLVQTTCLAAASGGKPELSDAQLDDLTFYLAALQPPSRRNAENVEVRAGEVLFSQLGCASCHRPALPLSDGTLIYPYTDLLLHDMGDALADGLSEYEAGPRHWRTAPLWGVGLTATVADDEQYLHDGRARSLTEAIVWHDGAARASRDRFMQLAAGERRQLLRFLESL